MGQKRAKKGPKKGHLSAKNGRYSGIFPPNASPSASPKQKGLTAEATSPCFKWSGREDLNLRPPAPKAGTLARLRYAPNHFFNQKPLPIQWAE